MEIDAFSVYKDFVDKLRDGTGVYAIGELRHFERIQDAVEIALQKIPDLRNIGYATIVQDKVIEIKHSGRTWQRVGGDQRSLLVLTAQLYVYDRNLIILNPPTNLQIQEP